MRRAIVRGLLLYTLGCVILGILIFIRAHPAHAQDGGREAGYIGAGDCRDCHRSLARDHAQTPHALALQDVSRNRSGILADFSAGEDVRIVQFPGEDAPRPFAENDIVYAVGAGRYVQRYVYRSENGGYTVLPAEWDTATQTWRPYTLADTWPAPEYDWMQNCAGCHTTGLDTERGRWRDDGVQCEACHGPGSLHAKIADDAGRRIDDDERAEIHAAIVMTPDAQVCGQCHSQGSEPDTHYPFSTRYRPGADLLDPAVFQLLAEDDPAAWYETGHGRLNNMQFNEWMASAHARSLETLTKSPDARDECLRCHSGDYVFTERIRAIYADGGLEGEPPAPAALASAGFSLTCVTCHSPHTAVAAEFNLVAAPYDLCTSCHQNTDLIQPVHHPVLEMFEGLPVIDGVEGVPSVHFAAEEGPRCVTCHMPEVPVGGAPLSSHLWQPVVPGAAADTPPDSCSKCHDTLTTADLQSLVVDTQAAVRSRLTLAWARLGSVAQPEAASESGQKYSRVAAALTFVQNDGSLGVHNYAYVDRLLNDASITLAELSVPGALLQPTEAPAPTATPSEPQPISVGLEQPVHTGFRPITIILIGAVVLILLIGSFVILRQGRRAAQNQETIP